MKKLLLITLLIGLYSIQLHAQDYNSYLNKAYAALEEGKADVAQANYNVYVKMTDKTDPDFELLLKDLKESGVNNEDWKSKCTIIPINETKSIAVQPLEQTNIKVTRDAAISIAMASRLGNYTDWRLPTLNEIKIIIPNIEISNSVGGFWFQREKDTNNNYHNFIWYPSYTLGDRLNDWSILGACIIIRTFNPNQTKK